MSKKENKADKVLENLYAGGKVVNLGENPRYVEKVPTGRPSIDYVTDGGIPKGRLILVAGKPSSGKSSWTIQTSDLVGKRILYLDTEATLTTDYILSLGADPYKFDHVIPESTEQMCDIIRQQVANYDVIVVDSINNSASSEQLQKTAGEKTMANRANVLSSQLPIIISLCNQYNTTLFILSQIRDNMNKANMYSPDTIIPGGNSLHHNSSMTLEFSPASKKKSKDTDELEAYSSISARMVRINCSKNKVGKPFRTVEVEFTISKGYTKQADIASAAVRLGIIEKKGSWLSYNGTSVCQGLDNLSVTLEDNPELTEELEEKIKELTNQSITTNE